jgi:hypothetical protein
MMDDRHNLLVEAAHARMDKIEQRIRRRQYAPTVPQYDLQGGPPTPPPQVLMATADLANPDNAYFPFGIGAGDPTEVLYFQFDFIFPAATSTLLNSHSDVYSANVYSHYLPHFGTSPDSPNNALYFQSNGSGGWDFATGFSGDTSYAWPSGDFDNWVKIDIKVSKNSTVWYFNDTAIYTDSTPNIFGIGFGTLDTTLGATVASETGEVYYFDHFKIGSSYGGSEYWQIDTTHTNWSGFGAGCAIVDSPTGTGGPDG